MNRYFKYFILFWLAFPCLVIGMGTKPTGGYGNSGRSYGTMRFYYQLNQFFAESGPQVELSYIVPFDQIQFISLGSDYRGSYNLSMIFYDSEGRQINGDSWDRTLVAPGYNELRKGNYFAGDTVRLSLLPGIYKAVITIVDANSQRKGTAEASIRVEDFLAKRLALNGIRLMKMYESKYWPWPQKKYGEEKGDIYFFYQYYSAPGGDDSVKAQYILKRREKGAAPLSWTEILPQNGVQPVMAHIPAESLMTGSYQLIIHLQNATDTVETADSIYVHNIRVISVKDYLEQIDQLEYIARGRELDSLKKATPAERESLLTVFWNVRDPDTTTSRNEYRDLYYDRVNYANEHFGSPFKPGWKSDMGLVYILYGQADDIERHPFDLATPPYETWYYYSVGLKFVFMDSKGIGDYELISPRREKIR